MVIKRIVFVVLCFLIGVLDVGATSDEIYSAEKIDGMYIRKISASGKETTRHGGFIRRASDGQYVYCIEPFVDLINNHSYEVYDEDYEKYLDISDEVLEHISLIAYYGYQYGNHTEDYWYYVTQMMIWRVLEPEGQFYFTDTLGGENNIDKYASEIAEIEALVASHYVTPQFTELTIKQGETVLLNDNNNVLKYYEVLDNEYVTIDGNNLVVSGTVLGKQQIILQRKYDNYTGPFLVYINTESQTAVATGNLKSINYELEIDVVGYALKIIKVDAISNEVINMAGIEFAIYDEDGTFILSGVTNEEGIFESDYVLSKGKYKIVEIEGQEISGYNVNYEEIYFEVTGEEDTVIVEFPNYPILGSVKIVKQDESGNYLSNSEFVLYDEDMNEISRAISDETGIIIFDNLLFGKYYLEEIVAPSGYKLLNDLIEFEIKTNEEVISINVVNVKIPNTDINYKISEIILERKRKIAI